MKTFDDLFEHFLRDIYYAERQILKALPKMARKAESKELKAAFEEHQHETEGQVEILREVFDALGKKAGGVTCEAIEGILEEGEEIMSETEDAEVRDAGMIAAAQAVEHYEITRYGTLIAWARQLGHDEVVEKLETILKQEKAADDKLNGLAQDKVNRKAA